MSDEELFDGGLFEIPDDFLPPPEAPHYAKYERKVTTAAPSEITLQLVGKSPLWGHLLWNAGIYSADFLDKNAEELVKGKRILELGAASALPSLICSLNGASKIVSTDYPDAELIENIKWNFNHLVESGSIKQDLFEVKGYIWGNDINEVVESEEENDKFDLIILSDVVFNHTEHHKLLTTCRQGLKKDGKCLVVFSPHRPHLVQNDLEFFTTCEDYDFKAEQIELLNWKPMFEEDDETVEIRSRIYSYYLIPKW